MKTLVLAIATRRPLVLIIEDEDVHWIDKATEEVVGAIVEAMRMPRDASTSPTSTLTTSAE